LSNNDVLTRLNGAWPPCVALLGGHAVAFDLEACELVMTYQPTPEFCHSGNIVQGGYITAMIDAVMAYAAISIPDLCEGVASLEIKVSFMAPGRPGPMEARGRVVNAGRSIGHLDGELHQNGKLIATATSTVKFLKAKGT
jgi:uncharacterized protein (TIGR00369 family)